MFAEIPLKRWAELKYPQGGISLQTLRRDIDAGRLAGRKIRVNRYFRYSVFVEPTTGDAETDAILKELS